MLPNVLHRVVVPRAAGHVVEREHVHIRLVVRLIRRTRRDVGHIGPDGLEAGVAGDSDLVAGLVSHTVSAAPAHEDVTGLRRGRGEGEGLALDDLVLNAVQFDYPGRVNRDRARCGLISSLGHDGGCALRHARDHAVCVHRGNA